MYSKYRLDLSINVVPGPIIHIFITSLKERNALNLRMTSRQELTSKTATEVKTMNFVLKHTRPVFNLPKEVPQMCVPSKSC